MSESSKAAKARWGGAHPPGSMYTKLNKQQRKEFEAWLKERDRDLGHMIKWGRHGCATTGTTVVQSPKGAE